MNQNTLLIKPTGPDCNLSCNYCFYLDKDKLYPCKTRMDLSTAEKMISQFMESGEPVTFSWQGGEPTLRGLDFFKEVIELQKEHGKGGQRVTNTIQTNGTLLNKEWVEFFSRHNFLVGLSLDGPRDLHDNYRTYPDGRGSFKEVMGAAELLQEKEVPFNVLTVLNSRTVKQPKRIINFFVKADFSHIQFIPAIETVNTNKDEVLAPFSPKPQEVGEFLDEAFQKWAREFPPRFSVRYFESLINTNLGKDPGNCRIDASCGSYLVVEHNGEIYPCDFYVEEDRKLGNLNKATLEEIESGEEYERFVQSKAKLTGECKNCNFLPYCYGGCQRYRALPNGPEGKSYLCEAYRYFLSSNLQKIEDIASRIKKRNLIG